MDEPSAPTAHSWGYVDWNAAALSSNFVRDQNLSNDEIHLFIETNVSSV
jgi:hypothetical protein